MSDRRQFLKETAVGLAATAALGNLEPPAANAKKQAFETPRAAIPPHRAVELPGIHGYAQQSVAAGGTVHFRVSSTVPYQLEVCRLAGAVDDPDSDEVLHTFAVAHPSSQPIHMGSYVHIANGLPADQRVKAITLECWVRPWRLNRWQGLLTQCDHPDACGYGIFLDEEGRVQFYLGDGGEHRDELFHGGEKINFRRWTHVVGAWDGETKTLWVAGRHVGSWPFTGPLRGGTAPIRLGASGEGSAADHFLDGDIAMPVIYPRALTAPEVKKRIASSLAYLGGAQLPAVDAKLSGPAVKINPSTSVAAYWSGVDDRAQWVLPRLKPGTYDVVVNWGVPDADANQPYAVELDGEVVITGRVGSTGGYNQFKRIKIGEVQLDRPTHRLTFRPDAKIRHDLVDLQSIELVSQQEAPAKKKKSEPPSIPAGALACWPLAEETGDVVADASGNHRDGRLINHGTWMVGGPSFNGENVGRYDTTYDPEKDPVRGHALRLASDDLYDCRWDVTHEYRLPKDAKPDVYVGRIRYQHDGKPHWYHITFVVKKATVKSTDAPQAPILVLLSTSTWVAYNSAAFPMPVPAPDRPNVSTGGLENCVAEATAYSMYRDHHAGQPAYTMGMNMPWPVAGPNILYSGLEVGYSHLLRGEMFLHRWLDGIYGDHQGYAYDIVTDYDLHRDPGLLEGYKTVILNGHSEYWSAEAYEGLDRYLSRGGTVAALSGNNMVWRTSFSEDGSVMECRKFDPRWGGRGGANIGELYHCHDKGRGSLMREAGYPAWKVIGLETCGWAGVDGVYHTDLPDHFLFTEPEDAHLAKDETFGHARDQKFPMAIAHEWDMRLSTLAKITRTVPEGAVLPEEPAGITTLARGKREGGASYDYFTQNATTADGTCAEMIYWQRPNGGRVFHAGAIGAGWALSADPKWRTVMRNVLHHFGVESQGT